MRCRGLSWVATWTDLTAQPALVLFGSGKHVQLRVLHIIMMISCTGGVQNSESEDTKLILGQVSRTKEPRFAPSATECSLGVWLSQQVEYLADNATCRLPNALGSSDFMDTRTARASWIER